MADLLGTFLILLAPALMLLMLLQQIRGTHPLMSLRNYAIVGAIIYIVISPGRALITEYFGNYPVTNPVAAGLEYTVLLLIFMAAFNLFYNKGWGSQVVLRHVPVPTYQPSVSAMMVLAVILTIMGFGLRMTLKLPVIGTITDKWGMVCSAMACGIVGWIWGPRLLNPAIAFFSAFVLAANAVNAITDYFSRRPLIAVAAALLWGMYYASWRFMPTRRVVAQMAAIAVAPVLFVALYTAARKAQEFDRTAAQQIAEMRTANVSEGLLALFEGQAVGPVSMWLIESYPERLEYRHLLALRCLVAMPIPRLFWEGKPEPLSTMIAKDASLQQVNRSLVKISPGIIGQSAAEGGLYALIIYAFIGAMLLRLGDEIVWRHPEKPLAVLAIGSTMGDVMGLPRGESVLMTFNMLLGLALAYLTAMAIGRFVGRAPLVRAVPLGGPSMEPASDAALVDQPAG